jgi:N-acetylglucosaminyl-diphospho-decaprenol L-rhamnosyltransferase
MTAQADPNLTSIIMVSHKTDASLDRAIAAVLAQTAPIELIVVNNGNPPETEARLAARAKSEPRMQLLTGHGNVGFGKGCNLGVRAARGAFLLFLQPRGLLPLNAAARLRDLASHGKPPFLLGTRLTGKVGQDLPEARQQILTPVRAFVHFLDLVQYFPACRLDLIGEPLPTSPVAVPAIGCACLYISAKDFWRLKGFDENYATALAVMDFCLRMRRAEGKVYFIPGVEVKTDESADYATTLLTEEGGIKDGIRYFHENFGHAWTQPVLWLLYAVLWARRGLWLMRRRFLAKG